MITVTDLLAHVQPLVDQLNALDPLADFAAFEHELRRIGREFTAFLAQCQLDQQRGYDGPYRPCTCGQRLRYHGDRTRTVKTLAGDITLHRAYYRCPGCGASQTPLDDRLNLVDGWSPGMAQMAALAGMQLPYRQAADMMRRLAGLNLSATAVERLTEHAGVRAERAVAEAEIPDPPPTGEPDTPPPTGPTYVQVDGVMTPLRDGWAETKLGLVKHPDGRCRYVHHLGGPDELGQRLRRTAAATGVRDTRSVVVMGDGAPWIWNLAERYFPAATQIVDWYHVVEHVHETARETFGEGDPRGHAWTTRLRDRLWREGAAGALDFLARSKYRNRESVQNLQSYLTNNVNRMNYPAYRRKGLDVGSGSVESGCKQVVQARLKRAGMRWTCRDASRVIALRCLYLSNLWDGFTELAA